MCHRGVCRQVYAQWCFPGAYSATKRAVARLTIFPLSLVLPSYMRRDMQRRLIARRLETPRQVWLALPHGGAGDTGSTVGPEC